MNDSTSGSARDTIMARIREALRVPAPMPHGLLEGDLAAAPARRPGGLPELAVLPEQAARPWLPDGGDSPAASLRVLVENLATLRAEVHRAADVPAAARCVAGLARERGWRRVAWHAHPLVDPVAAALPCQNYLVDAGGFDKNDLESCDAGITSCEVLVAQTGSILVSSRSSGGRALSILPHVHIVVAALDQIVATLADALREATSRHAGRLPSMLSFITGPSRTGDIERILVLGAHGPKELVVVLVG